MPYISSSFGRSIRMDMPCRCSWFQIGLGVKAITTPPDSLAKLTSASTGLESRFSVLRSGTSIKISVRFCLRFICSVINSIAP